jgi:hypothetical protein
VTIHCGAVPGCRRAARTIALALATVAAAGTSRAQAPAAPVAKPAETPRFTLGATIFTDFTYQRAPEVMGSDGKPVRKSEFEVRRAYVNLTGAAPTLFSFRITPDVAARQSTTASGSGLPSDFRVGNSLDGSLTVRLKYAYAQVSFDTLGPRGKGAWLRLGQQQTPYIDFMDGIYRYRFQGPHFAERQGLLSSSDVGVSGHFNLPREYGDVHLGLYNGETYSRAEVNGQKAFQARVSLRPFPKHTLARGLRVHGFYDHDSPLAGGARERVIAGSTFEHRRLNVGFDCIRARDRSSALSAAAVRSAGCSVWLNPRLTGGLEGLVRYDHFTPNRAVTANKTELIVGVAYWVPVLKAPQAAAVVADYDAIDFGSALGKPDERRFELKALLTF